MTRTFLVGALALASCIDFGYRLPLPPDAGTADGPGDADGACTEGAVTASTSGPQVRFATLSVSAPVLTIRAGDVVTWTNADSMAHTVTAGVPGAPQPPAQGGFDSGAIAPGATWAYRFCRARAIVYFCATHPSQMNNYRVVVGS